MFVKIMLATEKTKGPKSPSSLFHLINLVVSNLRECHNNVGCIEEIFEVKERYTDFLCIYVSTRQTTL